MEAAGSSNMLAFIYQSMQRYISENRNSDIHQCGKSLKVMKWLLFVLHIKEVPSSDTA
jgi:hypothetical protein